MICRNSQLISKILGRKSIFNMSKLIHLRLIYFISPLLYSKTNSSLYLSRIQLFPIIKTKHMYDNIQTWLKG